MIKSKHIKLLLCPFCGSDNLQIDEIDEETAIVECNGCNASGGYYYEPDSTSPEEAAELWNKRDIQSGDKDLAFHLEQALLDISDGKSPTLEIKHCLKLIRDNIHKN